MLSFRIFWFLLTLLSMCRGNPTGTSGFEARSLGLEGLRSPGVLRFSVPEDHHICLLCGSSDTSNVVWTLQNRKVLVNRQGTSETNQDHRHFLLQANGSLCLQQLDDADNGQYHCNQQLVAELQVLTGRDFVVPAGWTLLLPCSSSSKLKRKWYHRRKSRKREVIFTRFKNGTVKAEREHNRFSFEHNALQILDLQPSDTGEYECNRDLQVRVTVLSVDPEPTRILPPATATAAAAVTTKDVVELKKRKKRLENALLLVAVVALGLAVVLLAAVCVLLSGMKVRARRCRRAALMNGDAELQPWKTSVTQTDYEALEGPSPAEETLHYASLGRQNWRERPSRTLGEQNQQSVVYSSVVTRPAATRNAPRQ